jgi:DNA anti-recombination protein RmuC
VVPSPDPTTATTESLLREIAHAKDFGDVLVKFVREIVEQKIIGARETLEARLNGNDQAVTLLRSSTDKTPGMIDAAVTQLRTIIEQKLMTQDEKFKSVETQFKERDTRQEQTTKDSGKAIDAAFAAADKSMSKTETGFAKQIDEQGKRVDAGFASLTEKNDDLKERITAIESRTQGITANATENRSVSRDSTAVFLGIAAIVAAVVIPIALRLVR